MGGKPSRQLAQAVGQRIRVRTNQDWTAGLPRDLTTSSDLREMADRRRGRRPVRAILFAGQRLGPDRTLAQQGLEDGAFIEIERYPPLEDQLQTSLASIRVQRVLPVINDMHLAKAVRAVARAIGRDEPEAMTLGIAWLLTIDCHSEAWVDRNQEIPGHQLWKPELWREVWARRHELVPQMDGHADIHWPPGMRELELVEQMAARL